MGGGWGGGRGGRGREGGRKGRGRERRRGGKGGEREGGRRRREKEERGKEAGEKEVREKKAGEKKKRGEEEQEEEEKEREIEVNKGAGNILAHALAPSMVKRKQGHIVFMASVAGKVPAAGASIYNATKFGIRGFGLAMREELWGTGVGVSVICPTFVNESVMWSETGLKAPPIAG